MAANMDLVPATREHAEALAENMRPEDHAEVQALGFDSPLHALLVSLERSDVAITLLINGEVGAVFGVSESAVVWALTGDLVSKYPLAFVHASRGVLNGLLAEFGTLVNLVDARYLKALRWAQMIGFKVHEPVRYGPREMLFCPIVARRVH